VAEHDPQMLKGALGLLLLQLLSTQEDYGYSIVVRLQDHGFSELSEGTVYPALTRLESQGLLEGRLVRSSSGPARKYYRPTAAGRRELERAGRLWHRLVAAVAAIVPAPTGLPTVPDAELPSVPDPGHPTVPEAGHPTVPEAGPPTVPEAGPPTVVPADLPSGPPERTRP
jgi:PadR family transcriptional regulator PadR